MNHIAAVIKRLKAQDQQAFKEVVYKYSGFLMAAAKMIAKNHQDAEDILQDSFISIFKNIHQFEGDNERAFVGWMKRITINKALVKYKRKYYKNELYGTHHHESIQSVPDVYVDLDKEDLMKNIYKLPVKYRQVLCLFALEGYSHAEIANLLDIGESTSRSNYSRAKKKLSKIMKAMHAFPLIMIISLL